MRQTILEFFPGEVYNLNARKKASLLHRRELQNAQARLEELHMALSGAYACFDESGDPDLTEACIFEINALRARYNSVIRQIKTMEG